MCEVTLINNLLKAYAMRLSFVFKMKFQVIFLNNQMNMEINKTYFFDFYPFSTFQKYYVKQLQMQK